MNLRDFLYLDKFIFPKIVTFVYWFILVAVVIASLSAIINGQILSGLAVLIGGVIAGRIYCELTVVLFKINEHLAILSSKALQQDKNTPTIEP